MDLHPEHDRKVATVAAALRERAERGEPVHVHKGGVQHVVPLPGDKRRSGAPIDVSTLNRIIAIDPKARTCVAEPGIAFSDVVKATLAHGLLPTVVPELEGITLGGAVAGCSVESMSYKCGGFHDGCLEYEIVTSTGEVLTCSREKEPLSFEMIHGSYGTLGVLTRLTFKLVPATPYVRMEYRTLESPEAFRDFMFERCRADDYDFVDGIVHAPDRCVACLGKFVESAPYTSSYRRGAIFYKSTAARAEDYLSTEEYCFRYDADCHWLTRAIPPLEWTPVRRLLGGMVLGSTNLIRWSKRLDKVLGLKKRPDVVCDVFIPGSSFLDFFSWYRKAFDFWPLWVVPYRMPISPYAWMSDSVQKSLGSALAFDCAVYGKVNTGEDDLSAMLEEKTFELGGIKTLIGRNHYSRERFWRVYHEENYAKAKERLDPRGAFPGLYEKFHRA